MVKYKKIGAGGGGFDHVPISVFPGAGKFFANNEKREDDKVVITFKKDKIEEDVVFQGYDVNVPYNSEGTYKPQGMTVVSNGEFRIRDKIVPYKEKSSNWNFLGNSLMMKNKRLGKVIIRLET